MYLKNLLTDGRDELVKVAVREKRLRKLPEKQLQRSGDDMNVLPLAVFEVQLLCFNKHVQPVKAQQGALLSNVRYCSNSLHLALCIKLITDLLSLKDVTLP